METTEVNEWGSIHISQQVIAAIASLTAAKVPSVAALGTNIADAAAEKLGRTRPNHGVDVCRIPDVALEVQKTVKDAVEKVTACPVAAVHIIVQQVVFEEAGQDG